jgi:hypothetical protein
LERGQGVRYKPIFSLYITLKTNPRKLKLT